jgi:two-component system, NarL family, nitrate/nitrite response regulator NarL
MQNSNPLPFASGRIVVLVGDSTSLTGSLIAETLRRDRGLVILGPHGSSILTEATTLNPAIILLSEKLEGTPRKGFAITKALREVLPKARTIMLLDSDERDEVVEAFRNGARGVFSRNDPLEMLSKCVRKVHEGELWASDRHLEFLLEALADTPAATQLVDAQGARLLSAREEDVVRCLAKGLTNVQIASELKLTENTVKNYLFRIFNKLGVSSRVEVVIYARSQHPRQGRVRPDLPAHTVR